MYFFDEVLEHFLSGGEICNHAVFEWSNGSDIFWRPAQHSFRFFTDGFDAYAATTVGANRNYRGFVQYNPFAPHIDEGVGRS